MTDTAKDGLRAIVARIRTIEATLRNESFLTDVEWLLLPVAKQEVVLRRLKALQSYDGIESPTSVDAVRAAREAGVAIARFYQLVAHWREHDRSPMSLVPHQSLGMERPTRLAAEETAIAIGTAIDRILKADPLAPTGSVIRQLRKTWKGPGDLPSDTALRVFHERAIRSSRPTPGTLTLNFGGQPQERDVVAERFAETIVIDHVTVHGLVSEEDGLPPAVTLAIDLWSGAPIGVSVLMGSASPRGVVLALADVARRIERAGEGGKTATAGEGPPPRIVLATTFAPRWEALVEGLLAHGHELVDRRDEALHQAGPTRRILGMRLGPLRLERRNQKALPFEYDARTTAVQPLSTIERLLHEAVDEVARDRVPSGAWASATPFAVLPVTDAMEQGTDDETVEDRPAPARPGRPRNLAPADVRDLLKTLAEKRTPGGAADYRIHKAHDRVWHLTVTIRDASQRDAAFMRLAEGAMEISAVRSVPIIVHVESAPSGRIAV